MIVQNYNESNPRQWAWLYIIIIYLSNTARDYKPTPVPVHYNIITIIGHYNVHNIDTLT